MTGVFIVLLPVYIFAEPALLALGQDEGASKKSSLYLQAMYLGVFLNAHIDLERNFLTSLGKADLTMYVQFLTPFLHIFFCYNLAFTLDFGFIGIGASSALTTICIYTIQNTLMRRIEIDGKESYNVKFNDPRNF